jgi:hypothetical protein
MRITKTICSPIPVLGLLAVAGLTLGVYEPTAQAQQGERPATVVDRARAAVEREAAPAGVSPSAVAPAPRVAAEAAPVAEPAVQGSRYEVTISNIAPFEVAGADEPHILARVEGAVGETVRIDLGPQSRIAPLKLKAGDPIVVFAREATLEGRPVLQAVRVEAHGAVVSLVGPARVGPVRAGPRKLQGKILDVDTIRLPGETHRSVIATLQLEEDVIQPAILGPMRSINVLELRKGDTVTFIARNGVLDGRPVLVAEKLVINGKLNDLTPPRRPGATRQAEREAEEAERR